MQFEKNTCVFFAKKKKKNTIRKKLFFLHHSPLHQQWRSWGKAVSSCPWRALASRPLGTQSQLTEGVNRSGTNPMRCPTLSCLLLSTPTQDKIKDEPTHSRESFRENWGQKIAFTFNSRIKISILKYRNKYRRENKRWAYTFKRFLQRKLRSKIAFTFNSRIKISILKYINRNI